MQKTQNPQPKDLIKKQQPKLDNSLTYHRWLIGMQCRKDILLQNQVINKKLLTRVTPFTLRLQNQLKNNKMRFIYFIGFCAIFSMDKLYDMFILQNKGINKSNKYIQNVLKQKSSIFKWEQNNIKIIQQSCSDQEKKKKMYEIYQELDRKLLLTPGFMNKLGENTNRNNGSSNMDGNNGKSYKYQYVDIGTFYQYFKNQNVEDIRSKIRGQFPYLGLNL